MKKIVLLLFKGFVIYEIKKKDQSNEKLGEEFFKYTSHTAMSDSFIDSREVTSRFKLPPGTYVIIPSTFHPDSEGQFLLRVFIDRKKERNMRQPENSVTIKSKERSSTRKEIMKEKEESGKKKEKIKSDKSKENGEIKRINTKVDTDTMEKLKDDDTTVYHFRYEDKEDDEWAAISCEGTTLIKIGKRVTITITDHVRKDKHQ